VGHQRSEPWIFQIECILYIQSSVFSTFPSLRERLGLFLQILHHFWVCIQSVNNRNNFNYYFIDFVQCHQQFFKFSDNTVIFFKYGNIFFKNDKCKMIKLFWYANCTLISASSYFKIQFQTNFICQGKDLVRKRIRKGTLSKTLI
jgi:hypothetical protein